MECEICGNKSSVLHEVIFQGKRVYACPNCIKKYNLSIVKRRDKNTKSSPSRKINKKMISYQLTSSIGEEEVIEGYGQIIKKARESLGLTQEDLARELKVKLSYIKKIENERIEPSPDIVKKLEKLLRIKLTTKVKESSTYIPEKNIDSDYITLGDLLRFEEEE